MDGTSESWSQQARQGARYVKCVLDKLGLGELRDAVKAAVESDTLQQLIMSIYDQVVSMPQWSDRRW